MLKLTSIRFTGKLYVTLAYSNYGKLQSSLIPSPFKNQFLNGIGNEAIKMPGTVIEWVYTGDQKPIYLLLHSVLSP